MKRPDDPTPEPTGGHAADRLRDFLDRRRPGGIAPGDEPSQVPPQPQETDCGEEKDGSQKP